MPKEITKLKLVLYTTTHFLWKWVKNPFSIISSIKSAHLSIKNGGLKSLTDEIFRNYLPRKYLLKTKIHIKEPSSSIHSKIKTNIIEDGLSASNNPHQISKKVRILVIRTGAMGDVLLATPTIRTLHEQYAGLCSIDIATRYPEIFNNNPYITKTLTIQELRSLEQPYDLIINLDSTYEKNRYLHITQAYNFHTFGITDKNLDLQPELFPSITDTDFSKDYVDQINGPYIVCHNRFDISQPYRNVRPNDWQKLICSLSEKTNFKILQIGSSDMDIAVNLDNPNLIDARDKFNLQQLREVIAGAQLFLGTDAGPLHIAATTNTPIVSFFTIAHHEVRKPLRNKSVGFSAITPNVNCYGFQNKFQYGIEWRCEREDFACTASFNIDKALEECLSFIS